METKFTPGPWEYDHGAQIVEGAKPHMRVAFLPSDHAEYACSKPNAHLIASAPELYEALAAAVECGMVPISSASEGGAARFSRQVEVADMIRVALKKARGES